MGWENLQEDIEAEFSDTSKYSQELFGALIYLEAREAIKKGYEERERYENRPVLPCAPPPAPTPEQEAERRDRENAQQRARRGDKKAIAQVDPAVAAELARQKKAILDARKTPEMRALLAAREKARRQRIKDEDPVRWAAMQAKITERSNKSHAKRRAQDPEWAAKAREKSKAYYHKKKAGASVAAC